MSFHERTLRKIALALFGVCLALSIMNSLPDLSALLDKVPAPDVYRLPYQGDLQWTP